MTTRMGLMFGYQNAGNYYRFSMDMERKNRRLVKLVNGVASLLGEVNEGYEQGRWYAVEARLNGGVVEIWMDGSRLFQVNDVSHAGGKIALYAWWNLGAEFDDVVVANYARPCSYAISPGEGAAAAGGGPGTVSVTAETGCSWTAASGEDWVAITSGAEGDGNGAVTYVVDANPGISQRKATLTVAGQTYSIVQPGIPCSYAISPASAAVEAAASAGSIEVTAQTGCAWTAASDKAWLQITSGASGDGDGEIGYEVAANPGVAPRQAKLTIAGHVYTVTQAGIECTYDISPSEDSADAGAGSGAVEVTAQLGCAWTATSSAGWAQITSGASGNGDGVVGYAIAANSSTAPRHATLTIAGYAFEITQAGIACSYTISPAEASLGFPGGSGSVTVTAPSGCPWTAASNAAWAQITSGASGSGNGTVNYSVQANSGSGPRQATITIAGRSHQVTQAGATGTSGGTVLFSDDFNNGLKSHWTVVDEGTSVAPSKWQVSGGVAQQKTNIWGTTSNALAMPGTYLLTGAATWASYSVALRMRTVVDDDVMGLMFGYQNAGNYYRFSMDMERKNRRLVKLVNGVASLLGEVNEGYEQGRWYAVEARLNGGVVEIWMDGSRLFQVNDVSHAGGKIALYAWWNLGAEFDDVVVSGLSGGGGGNTCTYAISPAQVEVGSLGGTGAVQVTAPSGCSWTAAKTASWITITSGAQDSGNGSVGYSVAANGGSNSRQTTLTIAGLSFGVSQLAPAATQTIYVPAGGDLQQAIDDAAPGSTIALEPGREYRGNFILRNKPGSQYITITTSDPGKLPPAGKRITPAYAVNLPKIVGTNDSPVISTEAGAHHWRLVGLEIHAPNVYCYELVQLGSATATKASDQPSNIELDRVYVHGDPKIGAKRGVTLNSASTSIRNSYFSDFKGASQETQALLGWNGPGPFDITNNYLEAAGENIMFGGAAPKIQGLVPSDITIRNNHIYKPTAWYRYASDYDGSSWMVKNSLELKMARRVTIEGNLIENNWQQAQNGYAIVFTVRANQVATWAVVEDVSFVRNIVRHSGCGVNILGKDNNSNNAGITQRILIKDNLFEDIDYTRWGGDGRAFQVLAGSKDVTIDHNTVITNNLRALILFDGEPSQGFVYRNNIALHGTNGVMGSGKAIGIGTLSYYAPGYVFLKNVLVGAASRASSYPADNYFPAGWADVKFVDFAKGNYRLGTQSPYIKAGTDGKDLGADIEAVLAATAGAAVP
ncbi:MAG: hypothetical protein KIT09_09095 [Bryobacteraceae bacterium]|nr:hypothetical protein [Bryobacteraceae bacterium]